MKPEPPMIIKIGGSVLTDKKREEIVFRENVIKNICDELGQLYSNGYRFILVHGAGSAGHVPVKRHKLYLGITSKDKLLPLTSTQNLVNKLRQKVLEYLEKSGVPAVMFYPSSLIVQRRGRIIYFFSESIRRFYETGFVPVLSGDMVADLDDNIRISVCSGDQIVFKLAEIFASKQIIFGVDVDGIYRDFGKPTQAVIERITYSEAWKTIMEVGESKAIDVTGGMKGKLGEALSHSEFFKRGGEVWVMNFTKPGTLLRAIEDGSGVFTRIVPG